MPSKLDDVDIFVLRTLQEEGRVTNADLARRVELSPPSMLQRVRKLEEGGYITGYGANLDAESLGFPLMVIAMVSLSLHQDLAIEQFRNGVQGIPEVIECLHVSGEYDFLLRIVARSMHDYERIVTEHLSKIKAVGRINSSFVLAQSKHSVPIPL